MEVTIKCRINVSGQWWDVDFKIPFDPKKSSAEKVDHIEWVIKGLAKTNRFISRVGAAPPFVELAAEPSPTVEEAKNESPMFTWPSPNCGEHREDMKESKVQKEEGFTHYFCPKRIGEDYCKQRAKVEARTSKPTFWEVR